MVKNRIKVYARIKKESKKKCIFYEISRSSEMLTFYQNNLRTKSMNFRFEKIFDGQTHQSEVFDHIGKPVVDGVLTGFNGTIFAYGQTGTGKTYSLTGSHNKYSRRGLIPRSIEYIFRHTAQDPSSFMVYISYLEIYNEVAYDLLNSRQNASVLEELPRVHLMEDHNGDAHFRNLTVRHVSTEEEAMHLLFLGDTNRTIAETPLNEYSSRSHCVFTIYVTRRILDNSKIRRSKLNLVDLAGSERLAKTNLNGSSLTEAKHINLSLHYLEQVIIALSESKRAHIPYRNSVMTYMLKDSICGNCLTAMLATLSAAAVNFQETITTCKFSQRVSMLKTDAIINEESDPNHEIALLRNEVAELKKQVPITRPLMNKLLTNQEKEECVARVESYLYTGQELDYGDLRKVKFCVQLLSDEVKRSHQNRCRDNNLTEDIKNYQAIIKQKDEEISILMNILENKIEEEKIAVSSNNLMNNEILLSDEKNAFKEFMSKPENEAKLKFFADALNGKLNEAKGISTTISNIQKSIIVMRNEISENCNNFSVMQRLCFTLKAKQNTYKESLLRLQNNKSEIEYLKHGMAQAKIQVMDEFKKWVLQSNGIASRFVDPAKLPSGDYESCDLINKKNLMYGDVGDVVHKEKLTHLPKVPDKKAPYVLTTLTEKIYPASNCDKKKSPIFINVPNKSIPFVITDLSNNSQSYNDVIFSQGEPELENQLTYHEFRHDVPERESEVRIARPFRTNDKCIKTPATGRFDINAELDALFIEVGTSRMRTDVPKFSQRTAVDSPCTSHDTTRNLPESISNPGKTSVDLASADVQPKPNRTFKSPLLRNMSSSHHSKRVPVDDFDEQKFKEFMKGVPLTGDVDVDEEIFKFYRLKFKG